jgi:hypothetical protein
MDMHQRRSRGGGFHGRALALAALAGGLLLTGCAETTYLYRPAGHAVVAAGAVEPAVYDIPAEQGGGTVRVTSLGVTELAIDDTRVPVVRVRMRLANSGDAKGWTLDTGEVEADLGAGKQRPAFANSSGAGLPLVTIPAGEERAVDLFYRLPEGSPDAGSLPAFNLAWTVHTSTADVQGSTAFERVEIMTEDASPPASVAVVYAPYWWYDPLFYGRPMYIGSPWGYRSWYGGGMYGGGMYARPPVYVGTPWHRHYAPRFGAPHRIPAMPRMGVPHGGARRR